MSNSAYPSSGKLPAQGFPVAMHFARSAHNQHHFHRSQSMPRKDPYNYSVLTTIPQSNTHQQNQTRTLSPPLMRRGLTGAPIMIQQQPVDHQSRANFESAAGRMTQSFTTSGLPESVKQDIEAMVMNYLSNLHLSNEMAAFSSSKSLGGTMIEPVFTFNQPSPPVIIQPVIQMNVLQLKNSTLDETTLEMPTGMLKSSGFELLSVSREVLSSAEPGATKPPMEEQQQQRQRRKSHLQKRKFSIALVDPRSSTRFRVIRVKDKQTRWYAQEITRPAVSVDLHLSTVPEAVKQLYNLTKQLRHAQVAGDSQTMPSDIPQYSIPEFEKQFAHMFFSSSARTISSSSGSDHNQQQQQQQVELSS